MSRSGMATVSTTSPAKARSQAPKVGFGVSMTVPRPQRRDPAWNISLAWSWASGR
jgi:hypothetical protein